MRTMIAGLLNLCEEAGQAIMHIYHNAQSMQVQAKADRSPVTSADLAAHRLLVAGLGCLQPGVPVVSEEGSPTAYAQRRHWRRHWLVDPLDGTREFLARTGEFAISLALVEDQQPVLGVLYAPVSGNAYWGGPALGAFARRAGRTMPLQARTVESVQRSGRPLQALTSRHREDSRLADLLLHIGRHMGPVDYTPLGSALKFAALAAGEADFYPRLGPTCEWDTAAGQAILQAVGGAVVDLSGRPLSYNRGDNLQNPDFIAVADYAAWRALLDRPWRAKPGHFR